MRGIYRVTVGDEVAIARLDPQSAEFEAARQHLIKREVLAIECFHEHAARGTLRGEFYFSSVDIARSYALLNLKAAQERLAANMDRVLRFDGGDDAG